MPARPRRTAFLAALCVLLLPVLASALDHTVRKGETLFAIARRYGVTVTDLRRWNGLADNGIRTGQVLRVGAVPDAPAKKTAVKYYRVRKGETLWRIAFTHGVSLNSLMELNAIRDVGQLKSGQVIRITVADDRAGRRPGPAQPPPSFYLDKPVRGPVEQTQDRKGVRLLCANGTKVAAVRDATVEYTGTLVGYRNVVILNHGGNVYTVYAGLGDIFVVQGSAVRKGQPLGAVEKLSHYDSPFCYFELIINGSHADAARYLR
jgi:murein DD-endopeptidase MepM/ murein hydrolase activator NlpD